MSVPDPQSSATRRGARQNDRERQLEVAEEDSFPASDPPSITDPATTIQTSEQKTPTHSQIGRSGRTNRVPQSNARLLGPTLGGPVERLMV